MPTAKKKWKKLLEQQLSILERKTRLGEHGNLNHQNQEGGKELNKSSDQQCRKTLPLLRRILRETSCGSWRRIEG